jgi:hypothetical protein
MSGRYHSVTRWHIISSLKILNRLEQQYSLKIIHKHYEKFTDTSIPTLQANPHLVCLRSNGNPYFLYLMKYNFIQYCVFIDKKIQQGYYLPRMIITNLMFKESLFDDTVFDGEMVKANDGSWCYIINDLIVLEGQHLHSVNLPRRLNMLYGMMESSYKYDSYDLFRVAIKTYFKYNELQKMLDDHIEKLPYTCRGIYFKPLFLKFRDILYNFDDNLIKKVERIKYKNVKAFILMDDPPAPQPPTTQPPPVPQTPASQTFFVKKTATPDIYELYDKEAKTRYEGIACIPSLSASKYMREITKDMNMVDMIEMEFIYNSRFGKWMPSIHHWL